MSKKKSGGGSAHLSLVVSQNILPKNFAEALGERYLSYALSTITSRSLPDVRDGLKPVHRRLLYAMSELRLSPELPPKKSARVVGDVIGKYHPHGDVAVYDALVRLAQDFNLRYPLVDGQGNFGNIDGDNAAAMRYTEARLTAVARLLLDGLEEDAVDFRETYDNSGAEPVVLPAAFPNLLANGSAGIAVGMATSIPPHNVAELCDALRHLIQSPEARFEKLVSLVPGPDFPTGGELVEDRSTIIETYRTGRGSFRLRARYEIEKLNNGNWQIIVSEIPWQVQKSRLIEKIAELLMAKKLPLLDDIRDESADDVRLVLVPKSRAVDPKVLMESLFRASELEVKISLNMNVLDANSVPRVMNLREVLQSYLDHRMVVLVRRSSLKLQKIEDRLHLLDGYLVAYLNLDAVIKIIRTEDEPKQVLMKKFSLTDVQAEAILNMRLRALRKLEEIEIKNEAAQLRKLRAELKALLADESLRWQAIDAELVNLKKQFGKDTPLGRRRTMLGQAPTDIIVPLESMIEREDITILCSEKGWIRALRGHIEDVSEQKYKEGDGEQFVIRAATTDKFIAFGSNGRAYMLPADKLPRGRGFGEPLRMMIDLGNEDSIVALFAHVPGRKLLVASSDGRGFIVAEDELLAQTRAGKIVLTLADGAKAAALVPVVAEHVCVIGSNRKMLVFPVAEVPEMNKGRGVILQKYKDNEALADIITFNLKDGLHWTQGGRARHEPKMKDWLGSRASVGRLPPNGFNRNNMFKG